MTCNGIALAIAGRIGLVLGLALMAPLAVEAQVPTRVVAAYGDLAPGGGTFAPSLDDIGQRGLPSIAGRNIVFGSQVLTPDGLRYAVFVERYGTLRQCVREGEAAPGGGVILAIDHYAIDTTGTVFITVRVGGGTSADTVLRFSIGNTLYRIAGTGDTTTEGLTIVGVGSTVAPDGSGGVYFQATHAAGTALLRWRAGVLSKVIATGDAANGGGTFADISPATLACTPNGVVVVAATTSGGPGGGGLFNGQAHSLERVSDAADALPNLAISDDDEAFVFYQRPPAGSLFFQQLDGLLEIKTGTAAPRTTGTLRIADPVGLTAAYDSDLFFLAGVNGDADGHSEGLFKRENTGGELSCLVLVGDPAPAGIGGQYTDIATVAVRPTLLANDDGNVVFAATAGAEGSLAGIFTSLGANYPPPTVSAVALKKGKLLVDGTRFQTGARIVVNGREAADTKPSKKAPQTRLVSKTADDPIAVAQTVSVQVKNPDGLLSAPFTFTRAE
jgi:hypothetical protein